MVACPVFARSVAPLVAGRVAPAGRGPVAIPVRPVALPVGLVALVVFSVALVVGPVATAAVGADARRRPVPERRPPPPLHLGGVERVAVLAVLAVFAAALVRRARPVVLAVLLPLGLAAGLAVGALRDA
ncbi:hypothetical protein THAOC_30077, partial [Thalassiosira oceanica]